MNDRLVTLVISTVLSNEQVRFDELDALHLPPTMDDSIFVLPVSGSPSSAQSGCALSMIMLVILPTT